MTVPSFAFLLFAVVTALAYWVFPARVWRSGVLLAANVAFLACFGQGWLAYAPFAAFVALGFVATRLSASGKGRWITSALVVAVVGLFVWLKHYTFLPRQSFLPFAYFTVGLSYIFFRILHLIIEAPQQKDIGSIGPVAYFNYVLNFTALVSGPIQLYPDYKAVEADPRPRLTAADLGVAIERMVIGFFKVMVVSGLFLQVHNAALNALPGAGDVMTRAADGAVVAVAYTIYLYLNFSGYVDAVLGAALLYGLRLPENFDRPFFSENFIIFWSRWHMSLSNWLKTYVFNPLLMTLMRRFPAPKAAPYLGVAAFFVTFFLIGVWHGQTAEFVTFGVLQGLGVSVNKLYQIELVRRLGRKGYAALAGNKPYVAVCRGLTFGWFTLTLLWFWSNSGQQHAMAQALGLGGLALAALMVVAGATLVLQAALWLEQACLGVKAGGSPLLANRYLRTIGVTTLLTVTVLVNLMLQSPAPEVVYKSF